MLDGADGNSSHVDARLARPPGVDSEVGNRDTFSRPLPYKMEDRTDSLGESRSPLPAPATRLRTEPDSCARPDEVPPSDVAAPADRGLGRHFDRRSEVILKRRVPAGTSNHQLMEVSTEGSPDPTTRLRWLTLQATVDNGKRDTAEGGDFQPAARERPGRIG